MGKPINWQAAGKLVRLEAVVSSAICGEPLLAGRVAFGVVILAVEIALEDAGDIVCGLADFDGLAAPDT